MSQFLAPDVAEIERALDTLLQKDKGARVLAMQSPVRRGWPEAMQRDGCRFQIVWCPSELEVRERLDEVEESGEGVVVLTPLDAATLGDDIVARFPHARLLQTDRWSALRSAFRARDLDSRLRLLENRWLVDLLLERPPVRGYAPAAGGILDLESAWRTGLVGVLGLPDGRTDAAALLDWSLDPASLDRLARLPAEARDAVVARLSAEGGPTAELILAAAAAGRGADALPVALACGVVFEEVEPRPALREAAIRLEPMFGGMSVQPSAGRALAEAGRRILNRLSREAPGTAQAVDARAAAILTEVRADMAVALSPALASGLEARMQEAAAALQRAVETKLTDDAAKVWDLTQLAAAHDRAGENRARLDRLLMAARLVRWLCSQRALTWRSFVEAASAYAMESSFVDRGRHRIRSGDTRPELGAAYAQLAQAVTIRREEENHAFAQLLREWIKNGAAGEVPLPVEEILEKVVAPLARAAPVLLLVLDGLSFAVWYDLAATVERLGWRELVPSSRGTRLLAAAALPSVTEVSRASLLCGMLTRGDQGAERAGFAAYSALVAASQASHPPRLFHKVDFGAGPELGEAMRAAVANPGQRVVGVVHNAVDAQLSGSDQLDLTWTAEGLRQVAALLQAAREAGRIVVVTGDHGHVLEEATVLLASGSGDRWRTPAIPPREGEVTLLGDRVRSPAGGKTVVAAWSEKVRFAAKRGGYHGGASPQEVLVPVAILSSSAPPNGWSEAPPAEPAWWHGQLEDTSPCSGAAAEVPPPLPRQRKTEFRQAELFSKEARQAAAAPPKPAWLDTLLISEIYAAQRRLAGRGALADDLMRTLLGALAVRGGRITRTGLAQALGVPTFRLGGLVSAARRVLNLDQAQVLRDEGDDVVLDEVTLHAQFGLRRDE